MGSLRYAQGGRWSQPATGAQARRKVPGLGRARVVVVAAACLIPAAAAALAPALAARSHARVASAPAAPAPAPAAPPAPPAPPPVVAAVAPPPPPPVVETPKDETIVDKLGSDEALSSALARHGCSRDDVSALVRSLKGKLDLRGLREGLSFTIKKRAVAGGSSPLTSFELKTLSPGGVPRTLLAERRDPPITVDDAETTFDVTITDAPIETKVEGVSGAVRSSLYQAVLEAGEDANLVNRFVDVFAWNIDFYRQTRAGDQWKVLVEKRYAGGRFLGYGKVLAAEYRNAGAVYRGFLFSSKDGKQSGTYDDEGNGLRRTFLKAPMEMTRVTSSYGMRFHPLLKHQRMHDGIDYGAPIGTPIWTVADGVVEVARRNGGAGNMVKIKHMNGFETEYFHMSRFADGIKKGARVTQKQIIGYVGSTGLSTGPHLHFGMFKSGVHVDPSKQKFPNAAPVPKPYQDEFHRFMQPLLAQLQALGRA